MLRNIISTNYCDVTIKILGGIILWYLFTNKNICKIKHSKTSAIDKKETQHHTTVRILKKDIEL